MQPLPLPQILNMQAPTAPMPVPQHERITEPEDSPNEPGLGGNINDADEGDATKNIAEIAEDVSDEASDTDPTSTPGLDDMLGDEDDAEPVTSIMDSGNDDGPDADGIDIEDLPDPDPVPTMYSPNAPGS